MCRVTADAITAEKRSSSLIVAEMPLMAVTDRAVALCMASILEVILPPRFHGALQAMRRWGMVVLMVLFATGVGAFLMAPAQRFALIWARFLMGFVPQ